MLLNKHLLFIFSLIVLSACATKAPLKEKQPEKLVSNTYGIWSLDGCKLKSSRADMNITITDIYKKEEKIRLLLHSDVALQGKPTFKIYGLADIDIQLHGRAQDFSFELPTSLIDQARMHLDQVFLEITYMPVNKDYYRKAIFSMQSLPEALIVMNKCTRG